MKIGQWQLVAAVLVWTVAGCAGGASPSQSAPVRPAPTVSRAPSVSSAPSATRTEGALPTSLLHPWIRKTELVHGLDLGYDGAIFEFGPDEPVLTVGPDFHSDVTVMGSDVIALEQKATSQGCAAGDVGTYRWSLSPGENTLTLKEIEDACEVRALVLSGQWARSACPLYPDDFCLGDLEAGEHASTFFNPRAPVEALEFNRAAMTYEVPEGWSNPYDGYDEYSLKPQDETGLTGIYMWSEVAMAPQTGCGLSPDPALDRRPQTMADSLAARDELVLSTPEPVTVGGLSGLVIDSVTVNPAVRLPCLGDGIPYAPAFVSATGNGLQWGFERDDQARLLLLDLEDGRTLVIEILATPEAPAGFIEAATDIVDSMQFED